MLSRTLVLPLVFVTTPLLAQAPRVAPAASVLFLASPVDPLPPSDTTGIAAARSRGGEVGAALGTVLGAGAAIMLHSLDHGQPTCDFVGPCDGLAKQGVAGGTILIGAFSGAAIGYLVGHAHPIGRPAPRVGDGAGSAPLPDRGLKWWQGGLIGSAVGTAVGALAASISNANDQGCSDCTRSPTIAGPVAAMVGGGAILGFLFGGSIAQAH